MRRTTLRSLKRGKRSEQKPKALSGADKAALSRILKKARAFKAYYASTKK